MKIKSMKLNKNGKPVTRTITKAQMKAKMKKTLSQDFTHVAEFVPGKAHNHTGCGRSWGTKVKQVGRRHRCQICNKIVPVEQESSAFCSLKCERTHKAVEALAAAGFGRLSR